MQIQKEKTSASEYIFDFDSNFKSNENIDILRTWQNDNAIHDAIKIAYEDAAKFIKVLGIKLLNDNSDNSDDINDISGFDFNNDESDLNEDYSLANTALEVAQLSQLADLEQQTNEPKQEHKLSDLSKIELDYILNTSKKYFPMIELEQNELFYIDGSMNISQIIQIRASHNAI
ncbi:unnamed protein product [Rhizophagus irregularis]|uniref:Uncharacterized protein n=1 Tax=Rhizophagus irregularis TaxID=588596 RepID=A0A916EL47_9GLOM|nr:unnamed protein product [Rhizophagus irregularis]CAB5395787.1 unnamed protein product [Rhizophagus irregularis]